MANAPTDRKTRQAHICPRCDIYREAECYEPPVSICLICYHTIPQNRELGIVELRRKARSSVNATRKKKRQNNAIERADFLASIRQRSGITEADREEEAEAFNPTHCEIAIRGLCTALPTAAGTPETLMKVYAVRDGIVDHEETFACPPCASASLDRGTYSKDPGPYVSPEEQQRKFIEAKSGVFDILEKAGRRK
jgi:hypothetical protein